MLIINDLGNEAMVAENAFSFGVVPQQQGYALFAFAPSASPSGPLVVVLAAGTKERCETALLKITQGYAKETKLLDLIGIIGERPKLEVPEAKLIVPGNGHGAPA